ncbi:hypothetical protein CC80DRAFT_171343 [Byssothecium circinans]|uniref:Uncharacterized protein n=1 Tax=Byssothecium circinans TaxID=147558 RepID=A0A6A5TP88_9PLEO|nr:hypothetical protein CC80DRAFT_171343 [Byssothecium circinans]
MWLCEVLASGPTLAPQPCDSTQPRPRLWSTNSPLTEFAISQGLCQSGSAVLLASVIKVFTSSPVVLWQKGPVTNQEFREDSVWQIIN